MPTENEQMRNKSFYRLQNLICCVSDKNANKFYNFDIFPYYQCKLLKYLELMKSENSENTGRI